MSAPRYQLLVLSDQGRGERITLQDEELSIGRSGDVSIRFDNPSVSRHHAMFRFMGDRLMVEDVGSSGGTKVNNARIESNRAVQVENGDELIFGSFHTQVLEIDEYDDQFDDGEQTMFGGALDLPDDLEAVLAQCEQAEKNGFKSDPDLVPQGTPAVAGTPAAPAAHDPQAESVLREAPVATPNPYRGLTLALLVMVIVLSAVTLMAVFKWPVDLTALLQ